MKVSSCVLGIVVVFLLGVLIVLILARIFSSKISSIFGNNVATFCSTHQYLPYIALPPTIDSSTYDASLAQALFVYAFNATVGNCNDNGPNPTSPDFDTIQSITGTTIGGQHRLFAYVYTSSTNPSLTLISFTGSEYLDEWELDFDFAQTEPTYLSNYTSGVMCHSGFSSIYQSLRTALLSKINPASNAIIVGHSLGGALATMAAFDLAKVMSEPPLVYTYASPRVFNVVGGQLLATMVPTIYRIFNTEDFVPALPPSIWFSDLYLHVGYPTTFTLNLGSIDKNHVDAYFAYLGLSS